MEDKIEQILKEKKEIRTADLVSALGVTRQYAHRILKSVQDKNRLIKIGNTRYSYYVTPDFAKEYLNSFDTEYTKSYTNTNLSENSIFEAIKNDFKILTLLPKNSARIFEFCFTEMLNNAIEHSQATKISIKLGLVQGSIYFKITDNGIGIFKNVQVKKGLGSELEALQDVTKGKVTTMPANHTGQGIFFTSRMVDMFEIDSFGYTYTGLLFLKERSVRTTKKQLKGTSVYASITIDTKIKTTDIFRKYTTETDEISKFSITDQLVQMYKVGTNLVSRSEARRILAELDKFDTIILDYTHIDEIGQGFADEIYRVFKNKHPHIKIKNINMSDEVEFMIKRAISESIQ